MVQKDRYPIARTLQQACAVLKISPERVLRRAGMPADYLAHEGRGVSVSRFFDIWNAVAGEAKRPNLVLDLGRIFARGPFVSAVFAFSCSPDVETGLKRLALFKPLIGPCTIRTARIDGALSVSCVSVDPAIRMPDTMAAFELVYFLELLRNFTAEHVVPLEVGMPGEPDDKDSLDAHFGVVSRKTDEPVMLLSAEDAARPLISENPELWASFEKDLNRQLAERESGAPMSARVRSVLMELLPAGKASAEAVCARLNVSKRSLQRHLKGEGQSFQAVLDATRSDLSLHYLAREELTVEEISYLLAYRDPNSFYRAFHGWTGMTPMEARGRQQH